MGFMFEFWYRILPHYWETFWYEQLQWAINWCWNSPQYQMYELYKIEQEIWNSSINDNYYHYRYPPAA